VRTACIILGLTFAAIEARAQALATPANHVPALTPVTADAGRTTVAGDTPTSPTVFRTGVDLVALNVVVTDQQHRFVTGLSQNDFAVYEDGVQQDVSFFAATQVPLDLALLVDTSASMQDKMQTMQQAASGFLSTLRNGDRAAIFDIKDNVRMAFPLSENLAEAHAAVRATTARGGTALYNGLYLALKEMAKQRKANGEVRRQTIVVLSDGEDTASLVGYEDVRELAKQSGITIYTITLKSPFAVKQASVTGRRYFSQSEFAMKALAQETGARAFFPTQITELSEVYGSIATELAHQYAIGYSPKNGRRDGAFRRVIVRIESHPEARTRTRAGYLAARNPASQAGGSR
jgi:Ca-activated chloride channel family protein